MSKYCCFFCPKQDFSEKTLEQSCPECGRQYGFPLSAPPAMIGGYKVLSSLGRGFYGAAYRVERAAFPKKYVIKISPKSFYVTFGKRSFEEEARLHAEAAEGADHIVGIVDAFDTDVKFSDAEALTVPCHATVLEHVDGFLLRDYIAGNVPASAATICQIAIDLLQMRDEFQSKRLNHNDLHAENLIVEKLRTDTRRKDAIDESLRVKSIDLGSLADESKSTDERHGDLGYIASHLSDLLARLLRDPNALQDRDYRIALTLREIVNVLHGDRVSARMPEPRDFIADIRRTYYRTVRSWQPWRDQPELRQFADHYNAQTMESWNVPLLRVDPSDRWLKEVERPGPLIITGMRGCGKTMLLRAMDIHARLAGPTTKRAGPAERIRKDRFIGLFASAQRLLDLRAQSLVKLEHWLTRLYVSYALAAVRALLHFQDVDGDALAPGAHVRLAAAIADHLVGGESIRHCFSLEDLEQRLLEISVSNGSGNYEVRQAPAEVFGHLAEALRACGGALQSCTVFFLLDDVSTRYMELRNIEALLSALLFQSPICAFKFTSEWQTIELGLRSPGRIHPIRIDRDVAVFDLGSDVFKTINSAGSKGDRFVAKILAQRAELNPLHPKGIDPLKILGDVTLEQVARDIANSSESAGSRKKVYRGLSCLAGVCVGDIGDVIKLYEEILRRAPETREYPIADRIQSECFQTLSSNRLYDLNRRAAKFKNHALGFAGAAHELLARSARISKSKRLRQYSSIYVRITSEEEELQIKQIDLLRDLIDAGVFVFAGGSPRTKTRDSDPIQQFILSYRKIYGLPAFIGLADRDRFELSGSDLAQWLDEPDRVKEILLRNQINKEVEAGSGKSSGNAQRGKQTEDVKSTQPENQSSLTERQEELFAWVNERVSPPQNSPMAYTPVPVELKIMSKAEIGKLDCRSILVGLGFEDRALASSKFLADIVGDCDVHAINYVEKGNSGRILSTWRSKKHRLTQHRYTDVLTKCPEMDGLSLIDVTGLAKPVMFMAIRNELLTKRRVLVCHAAARHYYPLHEELEPLFSAIKADDSLAFLEKLGDVLTGETGPYSKVGLIRRQDVDNFRRRALIAFSSAKHQRLFSLLDTREFDELDIVSPPADTARGRVANFSADYICRQYGNAGASRVGSDDLTELVQHIDRKFFEMYVGGGSNVEIGLTGSKIQAVAAAIVSATRKIAQAWYVSPTSFDPKKYSSGTGTIRIFDIRLPEFSQAAPDGEAEGAAR